MRVFLISMNQKLIRVESTLINWPLVKKTLNRFLHRSWTILVAKRERLKSWANTILWTGSKALRFCCMLCITFLEYRGALRRFQIFSILVVIDDYLLWVSSNLFSRRCLRVKLLSSCFLNRAFMVNIIWLSLFFWVCTWLWTTCNFNFWSLIYSYNLWLALFF